VTTPRHAHPLELMLRPTWHAPIEDAPGRASTDAAGVICVRGDGEPTWLHAADWRLLARASRAAPPQGETIATFRLEDGSALRAVFDPDAGRLVVPFSLAEAYRGYTSESWRATSTNRRLSERQLALFYRVRSVVPRRLQLAARRRLILAQGVPAFPAWPLDTSVSRLVRFYAGCTLRAAGLDSGEFLWFWPHGHHGAVILTHDVESAEGIRLALELADLEEERGLRSSFNFGAWYDVDRGVLRELTDRGFEIGMHGLTHDRQLFASREAFEERLAALEDLAGRLGAVGFRSPATHRVHDWLGELPVEYDCTIPNSDPYEPQPGGCCSVWPFFIGPVVELPYTLPQDHTLLTLLRHRTPALWLEQAAVVEREHGLVQCVSHPDRGYLADADKRAVYAEFLSGLSDRGHLWRALPREVARWWRRRAGAEAKAEDVDGITRGTAALDTGTGVVELSPPR
jgi:peptidoglycan/xylan/chitin deacetylase (PgdA/CDA1 family)